MRVDATRVDLPDPDVAGADVIDAEHAALALPVVLRRVEEAAVGREEAVAVEVAPLRRRKARDLASHGQVDHEREPARAPGEHHGGLPVR